MEKWVDVKGYEGLYQVSNFGKVKSLKRTRKNHSKLQIVEEKIKNTRVDPQGYLMLDLYKDNKAKTTRVHRVVAEAFLPNVDDKPTVNHKDGNKANNHVDNLEWASFNEQNNHLYGSGLKSKENIDKAVKAMNKANRKGVMCINTKKKYKSVTDAARSVGLSPGAVSMACSGKRKSAGVDKEGKPLLWTFV